jgi:hypothetical protein
LLKKITNNNNFISKKITNKFNSFKYQKTPKLFLKSIFLPLFFTSSDLEELPFSINNPFQFNLFENGYLFNYFNSDSQDILAIILFISVILMCFVLYFSLMICFTSLDLFPIHNEEASGILYTGKNKRFFYSYHLNSRNIIKVFNFKFLIFLFLNFINILIILFLLNIENAISLFIVEYNLNVPNFIFLIAFLISQIYIFKTKFYAIGFSNWIGIINDPLSRFIYKKEYMFFVYKKYILDKKKEVLKSSRFLFINLLFYIYGFILRIGLLTLVNIIFFNLDFTNIILKYLFDLTLTNLYIFTKINNFNYLLIHNISILYLTLVLTSALFRIFYTLAEFFAIYDSIPGINYISISQKIYNFLLFKYQKIFINKIELKDQNMSILDSNKLKLRDDFLIKVMNLFDKYNPTNINQLIDLLCNKSIEYFPKNLNFEKEIIIFIRKYGPYNIDQLQMFKYKNKLQIIDNFIFNNTINKIPPTYQKLNNNIFLIFDKNINKTVGTLNSLNNTFQPFSSDLYIKEFEFIDLHSFLPRFCTFFNQDNILIKIKYFSIEDLLLKYFNNKNYFIKNNIIKGSFMGNIYKINKRYMMKRLIGPAWSKLKLKISTKKSTFENQENKQEKNKLQENKSQLTYNSESESNDKRVGDAYRFFINKNIQELSIPVLRDLYKQTEEKRLEIKTTADEDKKLIEEFESKKKTEGIEIGSASSETQDDITKTLNSPIVSKSKKGSIYDTSTKVMNDVNNGFNFIDKHGPKLKKGYSLVKNYAKNKMNGWSQDYEDSNIFGEDIIKNTKTEETPSTENTSKIIPTDSGSDTGSE